jgi:tyrosine-protein phosphatase SIW14
MTTTIRAILIAGLFLLIVGVPARYAMMQRASMRNFRVVEPQTIFRSGLMSPAGLERTIREQGIRTVVTLRAEEDGSLKHDVDRAEEALCRSLGIRYEKLAYRNWEAPNGPPPADRTVREFFEIMDQRNEIGPVLVHCLAGKHRTGAYIALYRMEYQGWSNAEAIADMQNAGYDEIDDEPDVKGYLERYVPRRLRR